MFRDAIQGYYGYETDFYTVGTISRDWNDSFSSLTGLGTNPYVGTGATIGTGQTDHSGLTSDLV